MQRALTRPLLALAASSQHISDAQNLCGDGERVSMEGSGTAQCEACPNRGASPPTLTAGLGPCLIHTLVGLSF